MAEKKFLSWVGFKGESTPRVPQNEVSPSSSAAPSQSNVARIRELESQLAELRSRRDITSLTKEEFEILASETAMTLIKTAQSRESKALAMAQKLINDSNRTAHDLIESAESKAKSLLSQAESRGRKYIEAAENDAAAKLAEVEGEAERLIASKKREASTVVSSARREAEALATLAKREADQLISGAVADISDYRSWLSTAISEAERLHRIQSQSLNAAEQAIEQTRHRLSAAFEKLSALQGDIDANLGADNRPKSKAYIRTANASDDLVSEPKRSVKKSAKKAPARKTTAKKSSAKNSASKKKSAAKRK